VGVWAEVVFTASRVKAAASAVRMKRDMLLFWMKKGINGR
jgi:hypothetical protein